MKRVFFSYMCYYSPTEDAFFQFFDVKRQGPVRRERIPFRIEAGGIGERNRISFFHLFFFQEPLQEALCTDLHWIKELVTGVVTPSIYNLIFSFPSPPSSVVATCMFRC